MTNVFKLVSLVIAAALFASAQDLPSDPATAKQAASKSAISDYQPINGSQRLKWFVDSTVGPETLIVGLFSAGFGTARDTPKEYGPHWVGFGQRYGMRLTGVSTGNAIEAGLGAIWGEDPRYFRATPGEPFKGRIRNVVTMTFIAHNRMGRPMPAYSRYVATPGNNFLSNTWRPDSEATTNAALLRTVWGFAGLMGKNAFTEFWPDIRTHVFHDRQ